MKDLTHLIVPDVHGRGFWKDVKNYNLPVIFLGDYLDPYSFEGITKEEAVENFKEILEFVKSKPNITLLLGNHDCTYMMNKKVCECRCDYENYDLIQKLFRQNASLFKLTHTLTLNNKTIVLSHSGFHPMWVKFFSMESVLNADMNNIWRNFKLLSALSLCSYWRGGTEVMGSPIWADIREYEGWDMEELGIEQIVGHTYLNQNPIGVSGITCVDLRRVFGLNVDGELVELTGEKINKLNI